MLIVLGKLCKFAIIFSFLVETVGGVLQSARAVRQGKIIVAGATGRIGSLVVEDLLRRNQNAANESISVSVVAAVRNVEKANKMFSNILPDIEIVKCDLNAPKDIDKICKDADGVIFCATGFSQASSVWDKIASVFALSLSPKKLMDVTALSQIGKAMVGKPNSVCENGPSVVLCSSAGVTRPTWSDDKKIRLIGAADIPIVRLNPFDVLGGKRQSEEALRASGARYCIVRPCGLNNNWPAGRPILSQGDVAVGRTNLKDAAAILVDAMLDSTAVQKTFESITMPGLPKPLSYTEQLSRMSKDGEKQMSEETLFAQYSILQQLVPGETLAPNKLAMGQTYDQLDKGEAGRLGERGAERAPIVRETYSR